MTRFSLTESVLISNTGSLSFFICACITRIVSTGLLCWGFIVRARPRSCAR